MEKKFFYSFIILSIFFFENKPSWIKSFSLIGNNFIRIKKLYDFSQNTHEFFKEYYRERNKNIKKILSCSAVLIFLRNHSIKSLKDIFKKESIKQSFCSSTIRLTSCSIIHFAEGLFSYMTLKNMKGLPIYRDPRGISSLLHEFKIDINKENTINQENRIEENHEKNISKSEIKNLNNNQTGIEILNNNQNKNKKPSSAIHEYGEPSNKDLLVWQRQYLTEEHKRELIKQMKASEEKLNAETSRYKEELQSKMCEIEKMTKLMEINDNEIIILKEKIKSLESSKEKELHDLKIALEKEQKQEAKINSLNQEHNAKILILNKNLEDMKEKETELVKQMKTLEEKLNTEITKYKEEFQSKISELEKMTKLMETNNNEIISLKKEIKSLERSKEQELDKLRTEYKIALENEHKNFAQAQAQLKNQLDQKQENKIIEIKSLSEQKISMLNQEYNKKIIALEKEKALNEKTKDDLAKTIEGKEKALLILGFEIKKKNQNVNDLKEQFNKLNNCWKEAKEKNNKEAKAPSLSKIDLRPLNNDLLSSLNRIETIREQLGIPPASL